MCMSISFLWIQGGGCENTGVKTPGAAALTLQLIPDTVCRPAKSHLPARVKTGASSAARRWWRTERACWGKPRDLHHNRLYRHTALPWNFRAFPFILWSNLLSNKRLYSYRGNKNTDRWLNVHFSTDSVRATTWSCFCHFKSATVSFSLKLQILEAFQKLRDLFWNIRAGNVEFNWL